MLLITVTFVWNSKISFVSTTKLTYILTISGLFIDVGTNYSVLDHTNLSFIYEDILAPGPNSDGEFVSANSSFCILYF